MIDQKNHSQQGQIVQEMAALSQSVAELNHRIRRMQRSVDDNQTVSKPPSGARWIGMTITLTPHLVRVVRKESQVSTRGK